MSRFDPDHDTALLPTAAHEAGHAIAHHLAGFSIAAIHVWSLGDNRFSGRVDLVKDEIDDEQVNDYLIGLMAGGEAEALWLTEHHHYRGALGGRALSRARRATVQHCCTDRRLFRRMARTLPGALSEAAARDRAHHLITRHWDRVERLTLRLGQVRHLTRTTA